MCELQRLVQDDATEGGDDVAFLQRGALVHQHTHACTHATRKRGGEEEGREGGGGGGRVQWHVLWVCKRRCIEKMYRESVYEKV